MDNTAAENSAPPPVTPLQRLTAFVEILLVALGGSFVTQMIFSLAGIPPEEILRQTRHLFLFLISEATITLMLIGMLLRGHGQPAARIGWRLNGWRKEAGIGLSAVPVLFLTTILVGVFFRLLFPRYVTEVNPLLEMIQTRTDLALFLISSVYVGGLKEEVQRAFVLVRFERYLGGAALGLVIWSSFFAVGHALQGIDNAIGAGVLGLLFGLMFLWRRNLTSPMVAHALYDILTLLFVWFFARQAWMGVV